MEVTGKVLGVFIDQVSPADGKLYHSASIALPNDVVGSLSIEKRETAEKMLEAITAAEKKDMFETAIVSGYDIVVLMEKVNGVNQPKLGKSGSRIARFSPVDGETQTMARGEQVPRHVKVTVVGW